MLRGVGQPGDEDAAQECRSRTVVVVAPAEGKLLAVGIDERA
jgi:hypothetical protein